ncbi:MAG: class I SAM-dependent methyltransferase [Mycobacteriales bacterium]
MSGSLLSGGLRSSYDRVARAYAAHVAGELAGKPADRRLLDELAARAGGGVVGDLGCGPGHVAAYLAERGVPVLGVDLSPGMLAQAPRGLPVVAADLRALPLADGVLSAAAAFYSLIHLPPGTEVGTLAEVRRVVRPGGVLLAAVHIGTEVRHLDEWWGMPVSVDFRFFEVAELTGWLAEAGWAVEEVVEREHYPGVEVETSRAYAVAVRPGSGGTRRGSGRP